MKKLLREIRENYLLLSRTATDIRNDAVARSGQRCCFEVAKKIETRSAMIARSMQDIRQYGLCGEKPTTNYIEDIAPLTMACYVWCKPLKSYIRWRKKYYET